MTVTLEIPKSAVLFRRKRFAAAQRYIDSECVQRMTPYVPVAKKYWHHAGKLRDSVGNPAPGVIVYTARFARSDYYADKNHQNSGNPAAQRMWFEFMKRKDAAAILRGAAAIAGGRAAK